MSNEQVKGEQKQAKSEQTKGSEYPKKLQGADGNMLNVADAKDEQTLRQIGALKE